MNPEEFLESPAGRLTPTVNGVMAFVPNPLPPPSLSQAKIHGISADAALAVGELNGTAQRFLNPDLLITPLSGQEALASSAMEGTHAAVDEFVLGETGEIARNEVREVVNYRAALREGFDLLRQGDLPLSLRFIRRLHATLMSGVHGPRGMRMEPGEFRRDQNYIGRPDRGIAEARFVPPPPPEMNDALNQLETFIHADGGDLPPLVRAALVHYQFETIHPFSDGNGRIGRLLVPILLKHWQVLGKPLLYLSPWLEARKDEYIDRLYEVSRRGAWQEWITFFLRAVRESARETIEKINDLERLHNEIITELTDVRNSRHMVPFAEAMILSPVFTVGMIAERLETTDQTARNLVKQATDIGRVVAGSRIGRNRYYIVPSVLDLIRPT